MYVSPKGISSKWNEYSLVPFEIIVTDSISFNGYHYKNVLLAVILRKITLWLLSKLEDLKKNSRIFFLWMFSMNINFALFGSSL